MFVGKAMNLPERSTFHALHSRTGSWPYSQTLDWAMTNTLAYYKNLQITDKKVFPKIGHRCQSYNLSVTPPTVSKKKLECLFQASLMLARKTGDYHTVFYSKGWLQALLVNNGLG